MKLINRKLRVFVGAALSFGIGSHAFADVYGLSSLQIENLVIEFTNLSGGGAGVYSLNSNQDAVLNGAVDVTSGAANCSGNFGVFTTCSSGSPHLSGSVQNAPGGGVTREENDYTKFGTTAQYSNSEAAIVTDKMLGDPSTSLNAISESNLKSGTGAQANTNINSNYSLALNFTVAQSGGGATIVFDAEIDVLSKVTELYGNKGLAQANSAVTVLLQQNGTTLASWSPRGNGLLTQCAGWLTCIATESPLSLNNSTASTGAANQVAGLGAYRLDVTGLTSGNYTLSLATTTSTALARIPIAPGC